MKTLLILLLALAVILIVIAKIHPIGKKISLYLIYCSGTDCTDHAGSVLYDVRYGNPHNQ